MRLAGLAPVGLVVLFRAATGDGERGPVSAGVDAGDLDDLTDVVAGVTQGTCEGERHGMRLAADGDSLFELSRPKSTKRLEQTGPAALPVVQNFGPACKAVDEFVVAIPPGLFAVRRKEVCPAGNKVSGDMLHDYGDGVCVLIERDAELVVGDLRDGSIGQPLVGFESARDGG